MKIRRVCKCGNIFLSYTKTAKFCSHECRAQASTGKLSSRWKGDGVGYDALHSWVQRKLGKPDTCEHCGKKPEPAKDGRTRVQWANKSHKYKRDVNDWIRLCTGCHRKYDQCEFCKNGHEYTPENTYAYKGIYRYCRACNKIRCMKYYLKKRMVSQ